MKNKRTQSVAESLIQKSREAAMHAVQAFNNPLTTFRAEAFIVLMVIAWTYLLHAHYRKMDVDYRYYDQRPIRKHYHRTKTGAYKYWELERCLNEDYCPLDPSTQSNLRFLVGLRHEIEHHQSSGVDEQLAGRYLACCLNYERTLTEIFGDKYALGNVISFALQFRDLCPLSSPTESINPLPSRIAKYVQKFDAELSEEEFQSPHFSYRLLFVRKLTGKRGQADKAIEFIPAESDLAKTIDKDYWVQKEVERRKYRPSDVVRSMQSEGYPQFKMHDHTELWQGQDAKNLSKGLGIEVVPGQWFWYDRWVEVVRKYCKDNAARYQ